MRKLPALIAAAGLIAVGLTACSTSPASDCTGGAASGESSALVTATGDFGQAPKVEFPTPLKVKKTEASELIAGEGAGIVAGQKILVDMAVYNATTGKLIEKTGYDDAEQGPLPLVISDEQLQAGLVQGLTCATEGSRIAVVVPPKDAFGEEGNPGIGVAPTDNLIFVIDVQKTFLTRANGADQPAKAGFPSVVLDETGRPGITIPSENAPDDLKIATLKKGNGAEVKEGDSVTVHYTGVLWDTAEVFDSSWERGIPTSMTAAFGADVQGGVIEGFADALIGQTVGSQVIAVIPPDKAYGEAGQGAIPANATLVFVVDILGIN